MLVEHTIDSTRVEFKEGHPGTLAEYRQLPLGRRQCCLSNSTPSLTLHRVQPAWVKLVAACLWTQQDRHRWAGPGAAELPDDCAGIAQISGSEWALPEVSSRYVAATIAAGSPDEKRADADGRLGD